MKRGRGPRFPLLLGGVVLFLSLQVEAERRWVFFQPCGFQEPPDVLPENSLLADTQYAPSYQSFAVDAEKVIAVVGYKKIPGGVGPSCSMVVLSGGARRLVVGGMMEILDKLRKSDQ